MDKLKPTRYIYEPLRKEGVTIEVEWFGSGWGITKRNSTQFVLNKNGEWEYQPLPSSRTEDFYQRCRYATLEEAVAVIEKFIPMGSYETL